MAVVLNPYLQFNGNAEEVLNFYKGVFGGEVEISRFSDFPSPNMPVTEEQQSQVMHGVLKAPDLQLMVSDATPMGGVESGGNIAISVSGDEEAKLKGYFAGLSAGGNVTMPMSAAPWGDSFGMLIDKYGVSWMVNITPPKP